MTERSPITRRGLLSTVLTAAAAGSIQPSSIADPTGLPRFGLVTYQWGKDWDLAALIANCEAAGVHAVEPRTTHAHGIEPELSKSERAEVRKRFADSPVVCVGPGSNERFDNPDPAVLKAAIERTKEFLQLSHDIGSTGVKVKPDRFHSGVPEEQTIGQIARSLRELGEFGKNLGQQVRLEIHGQLAPPPTIAKVMEACGHENARLCWNCNDVDLEAGDGFEANFRLVRKWFGDTLHVHDLDGGFRPYPYKELVRLLVETKYSGWCLLEAPKPRENLVEELRKQRVLFEGFVKS